MSGSCSIQIASPGKMLSPGTQNPLEIGEQTYTDIIKIGGKAAETL